MLVLSRKPMERLQIGDGIVVTVLQIRGNRVRLGIDAPKKTPVLRAELRVPEPPTGLVSLATVPIESRPSPL